MIVYSVEQLKGVIEGAMLASKLSEAMASGAIFPFVVLLLLYTLTWFSVQYSAGRKGIQSMFMYLIASSVILFMVMYQGNYTVILDPLYAKKGGAYVHIPSPSVSVDLTSENIKEELEKAPDYRGSEPPAIAVGKVELKGVPVVLDLFAFVDKMADSLYRLAFSLDEYKVSDNMEKQRVCWNPEYMTRYALTYSLVDISDSVDMIDPSCMGDVLEKYIATLNGYKGEKSLFQTESSAIKNYLSRVGQMSDAEIESNLMFVWSKVEKYISGDMPIDSEIMDGTWMASIGGGISDSTGGGCPSLKDMNFIYQVIASGVRRVVHECKKLYSGDMGISEEQLYASIAQFFTSPEGVKVVKDFSNSLLLSTASLMHKITNTGYMGKDAVSEAIAGIAFWSSQNLNFDIYAKMRLLMEIQGVALAFIIGFSPLLVAVSLFPVGDSIINVKLILITIGAYFLVKMWVPVVYIIYVLAWNKLFVEHLFRTFGG
ncbi:hypothetical protein [Hydrogenivirga sp.]